MSINCQQTTPIPIYRRSSLWIVRSVTSLHGEECVIRKHHCMKANSQNNSAWSANRREQTRNKTTDCVTALPVMLQTTPEMEMMMRVVIDVRVIADWPRADNFTSKQLIAVRKPVLPNIKHHQLISSYAPRRTLPWINQHILDSVLKLPVTIIGGKLPVSYR